MVDEKQIVKTTEKTPKQAVLMFICHSGFLSNVTRMHVVSCMIVTGMQTE